jgi:hypothetical protein
METPVRTVLSSSLRVGLDMVNAESVLKEWELVEQIFRADISDRLVSGCGEEAKDQIDEQCAGGNG